MHNNIMELNFFRSHCDRALFLYIKCNLLFPLLLFFWRTIEKRYEDREGMEMVGKSIANKRWRRKTIEERDVDRFQVFQFKVNYSLCDEN